MKLYQVKNSNVINQADPYIIRARDKRYYMYATGGQLYSSDMLLSGWKYEGICLDMPGQKMCWAPSVIEIDSKYYMYYSSVDKDYDKEHGHSMRVAVSDTPNGIFRYVKILLPPFSIDAHVVKTPLGLYMFYCNNNYTAERAGTYILCDKMKTPFELEGKPISAVIPTIDEEIYMRNRFKKGQHWHTIEGAFYFFYKGIHFLMYSGACYQNPTYFIGYCVAHAPEDIDLRQLKWKKYPNSYTYTPLVRSNDFVEGMGHNSVIFDDGKCYIVYHGRDCSDVKSEQDTRVARIDEMLIDGEKLIVNVTK